MLERLRNGGMRTAMAAILALAAAGGAWPVQDQGETSFECEKLLWRDLLVIEWFFGNFKEIRDLLTISALQDYNFCVRYSKRDAIS